MGFFTDEGKEFHLLFVSAFPVNEGSMHSSKERLGMDGTCSVDEHAGKDDKRNMNDKHRLSAENELDDGEGVDDANNPIDKIVMAYRSGMDGMDDTDEKIGMSAKTDQVPMCGVAVTDTNGRDDNETGTLDDEGVQNFVAANASFHDKCDGDGTLVMLKKLNAEMAEFKEQMWQNDPKTTEDRKNNEDNEDD